MGRRLLFNQGFEWGRVPDEICGALPGKKIRDHTRMAADRGANKMNDPLESRHSSSRAYVHWVILILLAIVVVVQSWNLANDYVKRRSKTVWDLKGFSAIERSAILSEGMEFAEYMSFLRDTVPENAKVVMPPHQPVQPLSNMGFAEYFLMPRTIINCGSDEVRECVLRMTGEHSYIVTAWKFPPKDAAESVKKFIPFRNELGVYAPK